MRRLLRFVRMQKVQCVTIVPKYPAKLSEADRSHCVGSVSGPTKLSEWPKRFANRGPIDLGIGKLAAQVAELLQLTASDV